MFLETRPGPTLRRSRQVSFAHSQLRHSARCFFHLRSFSFNYKMRFIDHRAVVVVQPEHKKHRRILFHNRYLKVYMNQAFLPLFTTCLVSLMSSAPAFLIWVIPCIFLSPISSLFPGFWDVACRFCTHATVFRFNPACCTNVQNSSPIELFPVFYFCFCGAEFMCESS